MVARTMLFTCVVWGGAMLAACQVTSAAETSAKAPPKPAPPPRSPAPPPPDAPPRTVQELGLSSPAFHSGQPIPRVHTCEGQDISPALEWTGAPTRAASVVVLMTHDEPRAPDQPSTPVNHWVIYDLPPTTTAIPRGVTAEALPGRAKVGINDWGETQYRGPCPPRESRRYTFRVLALDRTLAPAPDLAADEARAPLKLDVQREIAGHIVAEGTLAGTYEASFTRGAQ